MCSILDIEAKYYIVISANKIKTAEIAIIHTIDSWWKKDYRSIGTKYYLSSEIEDHSNEK